MNPAGLVALRGTLGRICQVSLKGRHPGADRFADSPTGSDSDRIRPG